MPNDIEKIAYSFATDLNGLEEENRFLKQTVESLRQEVDRFRRKPLLVCKVKDIANDSAIVRLPNGNEFYVDISGSVLGKIKVGDNVLTEQKNLTIIDTIPGVKKFDIESFVIVEKPKINWDNIGGLENQQQEIKEVIELPLKKPELFKKVGISPPKGILLYGPSGTGKTLLAKAVASSSHSTFIEIVGSELVQKFIGEGSKLVKEIFELAREKAPSIVFIDEIDAIAATRVEVGTSGEREVQRTFMQLLAEIDGFENLDNVKIIGCTNRKDILDPAIIRPGRLDRLIYVGAPDDVGRNEIFKIHSGSMRLSKNVNVSDIITGMNQFTGADIKSVCTEAGYFAIRQKRNSIKHEDFNQAIEKVKKEKTEISDEHKVMFG